LSLQHGRRSDWVYLLLIGLQGGPQVTLVSPLLLLEVPTRPTDRELISQATNSGVRELPTAMMTTPYAALISDPSLFCFPSASLQDPAETIYRNRRFLYIACFWTGAFTGGALMKWSNLWALTGVVGALKAFAALLVWVSKAEEAPKEASQATWRVGRSRVEEEAVAVGETETEGSALIIEHRRRMRTSSIFGSLSSQKPRDEHSVAM
jgi:hypothetical protein